MLNPFPQLLFLGFFVPTILRVAAAVALGYSAWRITSERAALSKADLPIIGTPPVALIWISGAVTMLVAAALFFGYGTQVAAILGGIISLKYAFIPKRLVHFSPLSRSAYLLLFVICLALLVSGAGAFAMDVPL
jgi:uncharacterized membrane protein YphA (DoxX/SURF4 family)